MAAANAQCIELLPYEVRAGLGLGCGGPGGHGGGLDRYSSLDSNDTFLSCNTHPYPSQGSLAGLEELAAKGSMAANGSMPAVNVNIDGNKSGVYVNPFDPKKRGGVLSPGSGNGNGNRRVRIAAQRSLSSDNELEAWADCIEEGEKRSSRRRGRGQAHHAEDVEADEGDDYDATPKHRRTRVSQVSFDWRCFLCSGN